MPSRQSEYAKRHRAAGLCENCPKEVFLSGRCFGHALYREFHKHGMGSYTRRFPKAWTLFVNGMAARYQRVLMDEGFMVDAITEPQAIVRLAGMTWARGPLRRKVLEVINKMDDLAIRRRFRDDG